MKKWLFNPFAYIAGLKALLPGCVIILLTAIVCIYSKTHFDGVLDAHTGTATPLYFYFIEPAIDWVCVVILFFIAGIIFSKSSIRFIDVAGTMALARAPMLFAAIISFGIHMPENALNSPADALKYITPAIIFLGLSELVIAIWMIVLMYNAFSVSCNIKGGKATAVFIAVLVIAEITSKIVFHQIY